ncbi:MAG: LysR family transcriptional regulator [Pigmentiphaga sp.]
MARPTLDAIDAFVQIVEAGSLTGAARRMGVAKSVISDRLASLEAALGVTVLRRTTRRVALTEACERFYTEAVRVLQQVDEAAAEVAAGASGGGSLRGRLRIAAPVSFGAVHLGRMLMPFLSRHAHLQCQIELSDSVTDLVAGHFDFAIRIGRLNDSTLLARRLGDIPRVVCASPGYLERHGVPQTPEALRDHAILGYSQVGASRLWTFHDGAGRPYVAPTPAPRISANNGEVIRDAAIQGLGLAVLPSFIVAAALANGDLAQVLTDYPPVPDGLHLVYPADRQVPRKSRETMAYLAEAIRPWLSTPAPPS